MLTKLVNGVGALIAFNREIGSAATDLQNGNMFRNPQQSLQNLLYASVGVNQAGTVDPGALTASVTAKIGGYAFVKVAKFFLRRFRI
jgi:hypothetical protein